MLYRKQRLRRLHVVSALVQNQLFLPLFPGIVPVYRKHDTVFNLYVTIISIQLHINNQLPLAQCPLVYLKQLYLCPGRDSSAVLDNVPDHVVVVEDGSPSVDPETSDGLTSRVDVAESKANGCDKTADIVANPWKREHKLFPRNFNKD